MGGGWWGCLIGSVWFLDFFFSRSFLDVVSDGVRSSFLYSLFSYSFSAGFCLFENGRLHEEKRERTLLSSFNILTMVMGLLVAGVLRYGGACFVRFDDDGEEVLIQSFLT